MPRLPILHGGMSKANTSALTQMLLRKDSVKYQLTNAVSLSERPRLNLSTLSRTGYWHCLDCERITTPVGEPGETYAPQRCRLCGSDRIRWAEPAFTTS